MVHGYVRDWYLISGEGDCGEVDCGEADCGEADYRKVNGNPTKRLNRGVSY